MFKIKGEALQQVVGSLTKGAKRARLSECPVFVTEENIKIVDSTLDNRDKTINYKSSNSELFDLVHKLINDKK
ncbi:hypothetical protein [Psychrobacillus vulpis]|uniref:Uncharacterized protein n=1 Tax=Psychrobacillus vulpis TaxID=2325572 RepID=A0A544TDG1_9BACI|nr:hypothetical protein [Psychrobacillus vulpis]TQR15507.1 hypothetical protein FG384_19240 [Psychrobacillus vulpis]